MHNIKELKDDCKHLLIQYYNIKQCTMLTENNVGKMIVCIDNYKNNLAKTTNQLEHKHGTLDIWKICKVLKVIE
jgi:hypothetical protein